MLASLMSTRRFAPLFWCQFFSAFNDNFIKNTLIVLVLFGIGATAPMENGASLATLATAMLAMPPLFLSGLAGQLADRYDKALVARRIKLAEILVAAVAAVGIVLHSVPLLMSCVLGLGVMAAFFSPIKYGILPDHLALEELPAGNALVEAGTFLSILLGIIAGGFAPAFVDEHVVAVLMVIIAVGCWASAVFIPRTGEAAPTLRVDPNILRSTRDLLRALAADRRLLAGAIAVSWFWLIGAVVLSLVPPLAKDTMHGDQHVATLFLTAFSIGIGIGSILAARLVAGRIILVLGPIGCVLMALVGFDIAWVAAHAAPATTPLTFSAFLLSFDGARMTIDLVLLAVAAGLFIVPVFAAVQAWAEADQRARVIAGVNVLSALFMTAGAGALAILQSAGVSTPVLLAGVAVLNLVAGGVFAKILPMSPLRDFILLVYRLLFRLEVKGIENLDEAGPQRIVAVNHASFLDAGLMLALLDKDPVFAIDYTIARAWWVKPFLRLCRAFPLDPTKPLATRALINAVKAGETLVIFPEGRLTVTGSLMKVYDGAGLIADKSDGAVVPVRIEGLERTPFSRLSRRQVSRRWLPKVVVTFTEPVRLGVDPALRGKKRRQAAGAALYDVMSNLIFRTTPTDCTVFEAFAAAAARNGKKRVILEDPITGKLTYKRALTAIAVLGQKLKPLTKRGEHVGVLLPNANGVAVTVLALHSIGRVPAMLNYTSGAANMEAACKAAEIRTILASRAFVEKGRLLDVVARLETVAKIVWLEDVRAGIGILDKLAGLLRAGRPGAAVSADEAGVILFTSGSEGTPKGVVLTHRNILSNCAQVAARIDFGPSDTLFNVLPVFHSFGMTGGMVLPLISGVRLYLYPSPLHYRVIPELVYGTNATIMFGTDTFLAGYAKSANPYDFRSLRYVLAGAEPVRPETRRLYNEKFGLRILEGYGVTETSPVLAVNTPMFNRNGTVGRILPGMEARLEEVPGIEEGGRLYVRGPNVMAGYLKAESPGVLQPPEGGWHDTGDIVTIDPQGYVTIKGRAKRFAKVAGEMVSLAAVEQLVADLWPGDPVAVVAMPDERKGERVVVVTTRQGATRADVVAHLKRKHAADVMAPAEVVVLDKLPLLGSGKTDYVTLNKLARERPGLAA
jgi:acyl-[acyl-carrier-protein]-phospholipid O-acyltransferase / long-chain-fatty-acid--[acyl-carrier-protein] ligase